MNQEPNRIWEEGEVASSESLRAIAAATDVETWRDANLIAAMFDFNGLARALHVITQAGGLGYLLSMTTPDLLSLGLSPVEADRFASLPVLASSILEFRYKGDDPSTRRGLADELVCRGVQFDSREARFGIVGWAADGHRVLDRTLPTILFGRGARAEVLKAAQIALRAGATVVTLWRWSPYDHVTVTDLDQSLLDEVRIVGAVLNVTVGDYMIVCPHSDQAISMAVLQQWPRS